MTNPCDVLVQIPDAKPSTNRYIVDNDIGFARGVAKHKNRYKTFKCGET